MGINGMSHNRNSSRSTPTTDRDDDDFKTWFIFQHFQRFCGYASDKQWLVTRMNIAIAVLSSQCFTVQFRLIVICAMKDDFCSHALHCGNFARIGVFGDDNNCFDTKEPRCVCDGLPMIAGGSSDDATLALLRGELGNQIDAAAHFESSYWLVVF